MLRGGMTLRGCLALAFAIFLVGASPAVADMFGRADGGPPAESAAPILSRPASRGSLPAPLQEIVGRALVLQNRLNSELRGQLRLVKEGSSWRPAIAIVLISFLYGVFHAVGPGHGKVVVGSYFLTRRARLLHGFAMSGAAALVQALSAVLLVSLLAAMLEMGSGRLLSYAATLETVSYGVITGLGLWMAWGTVTRRVCCDHADEPDHDHRGHGDEHVHGPDCHHPPPRAELSKALLTGAAVGLRPCSGAILVLLFTLANAIYPIGIVATFAMGLGVAITVSVVSLASLGVHRSLARIGRERRVLAERVRMAAGLAGAMAIILFGALELLGIWTGAITPMAG